MSEEEITGILKHLADRIGLVIDILTRMEGRQIEVKKEIEAEPTQDSFATRDQ